MSDAKQTRPGTLTVTVGSETATLDPLSPTEKFERDRAKVSSLIDRMGSIARTTPQFQPETKGQR